MRKQAIAGILTIPLEKAAGLVAKLTRKQREVADLIANGHSSAEICQMLDISVKTLDIHRCSVCGKLGVPTIGIPKVMFAARFYQAMEKTDAHAAPPL